MVDQCPICGDLAESIESSGIAACFEDSQLLPRSIKRIGKHWTFLISPGPLTPGYGVIVPNRHILAVADANHQEFAELLELLELVKDYFDRKIHCSQLLFAEHGSTLLDQEQPGCVLHAHIHIFSLIDSSGIISAAELEMGLKAKRYASVPDLFQRLNGHQSYVALWDEHEFLASQNAVLPRQFVRRLVARQNGQPDRWSWTAFPNEPLFLKNLELMEELGAAN